MRQTDFSVDHAGDVFNEGCLFFSVGLRFFFASFPLIMYFFGPWHMLVMSVVLVTALVAFDGSENLAGVNHRYLEKSDSVVGLTTH